MVALSKNSKGKLNKIYKKYVGGGGVDVESNPKITGNQVVQGGIGIAGLAAPLVAQQDDVAGGVLGGAASGASAGSIAGPWGMAAGAVIGGTIGGVSAQINSDKAKKAQQEYQDAINKQNYNLAVERGKQTPVNGNQVYSLTERKQGGKLSKLSNNTILASGATHEEGGIKLPQLGAEVEDKETLKEMKDGGTYVMSDTLKNPQTGNTFAKDDLKLSKIKGRIEKMYDTRFSKNAINLLKDKEQKLVDLHEQVRQEEGLETANDTQVAKNGGLLKYSGLQTPPSKITLNNQKFLNNNFNAGLKEDGIEGINTRNGINNYKIINPYQYSKLPTYGYENEVNFPDPKVTGVEKNNNDDLSSLDNMQMISPDVKKSSKFNGSSLSKLTPYIDNITGALYNNQRSKEKLPDLKTLDYLNPKHVNYSQAIKDTRDTTTAFNRGIDTTNVNQGNANVMKAFALGEQQKGIARISQEESNANVRIDNEFAGRNKAIEEKNNMTIFNNAERNRLGRDEIRRESQQNIVDANMKLQTQLKSKNQKADDKVAELAHQQKSIDFIESKKAEREANESGIWKNGRFVRGVRNGGKLSKLKISY